MVSLTVTLTRPGRRSVRRCALFAVGSAERAAAQACPVDLWPAHCPQDSTEPVLGLRAAGTRVFRGAGRCGHRIAVSLGRFWCGRLIRLLARGLFAGGLLVS